jgi:hypothetical protein
VEFGSDWPHGEGPAQPSELENTLDRFDADQDRIRVTDEIRRLRRSDRV